MEAKRDLAVRFERRQAFALIRILFGIIWLINTVLQTSAGFAARFLTMFRADWVSGQPPWLAAWGHAVAQLVSTVGTGHVVLAVRVLNGLLAASLLSGVLVGPAACIGIVYNLLLWSTIGGLGGPYTQGATDPGTAIIYALVFYLVLETRPGSSAIQNHRGLTVSRWLFGAIWAFDAFWKWHPYFLKNSVSYLVQSQAGQPHWISVYIGLFVSVIKAIGSIYFGVVAALSETIIAASLLSSRLLRWLLPFGLAYSLVLWTTAEGWGGPYGPGFTGNKGDVLGTTNIYALVFLYLMAKEYLSQK